MRLNYKFLYLIVPFVFGCSLKYEKPGIPKWVQEKIKDFEKNNCKNGRVFSYTFKGEKVYLFDQSKCCCDLTSDVTDVQGKLKCQLGGISGVSFCDSINFFEKATDKKLIWGQDDKH